MYLSELKIENFRGFSNLSICFNKTLNLIVGENDAGKTAIIDGIKLVLGTLSNDWYKISDEDFKDDGSEFCIVCIIRDFQDDEAASFLEWISFDEKKDLFLKLTLRVKKGIKGRPYQTLYAGVDEDAGMIQGEARERLRVTYLRPLRDAEFELAPKRNSRLSQILDSYKVFAEKENHPLVEIMTKANDEIATYFNHDQEGRVVQESINKEYLKNFSLNHNVLSSKIGIVSNRLKSILEKLELKIFNHKNVENLGLGSNNLLFIAAEMLLLKKENEYVGLKLALIEEIEAHLHPQSQLNLIDFLEKESEALGFQSIITTHSTILSSKVNINSIIICKNGNAFRMDESNTKLNSGDYEFLRRFLDATKANLFFANGVIIVEGDAENLFLPILADIINKPLFKHGVSIVNVGSTALLRYAKIFQRREPPLIGIPVACITDRDIPPKEAASYRFTLEAGKNKGQERELLPDRKTEEDFTEAEIKAIEENLKNKYEDGDVKLFYAKTWTLEYEIANSCLREYLYTAVKIAKQTNGLEVLMEASIKEEILEGSKTEIKKWLLEQKSGVDIALRIFEPLIRKQVSKAIVAQTLSELLILNKDKLDIRTIQDDKHLKYLIDAINYAISNNG